MGGQGAHIHPHGCLCLQQGTGHSVQLPAAPQPSFEDALRELEDIVRKLAGQADVLLENFPLKM